MMLIKVLLKTEKGENADEKIESGNRNQTCRPDGTA